MVHAFLHKRFIGLNSAISVLFTALLALFLLNVNITTEETLYRVAQAILFTLGLTFTNTWLLKKINFSAKQTTITSKLSFYVASYATALLFFTMSVVFYTFLSGNGWEGNGNKKTASFLAAMAVCIFNTIVLVIQQLLISQYQNSQGQIEKLQLKASLAESANLLLRQQIQPHFLFNALTVLKSVYKQDVKKGETYLVHLANFLRASLSNHKQTTALLKEELEFALNYLNMQKIRFGAAVTSCLAVDEKEMQTRYLPYFCIQPLIENALKHNGFTEEKPLFIEIFSANNCLVVRNNRQAGFSSEPSTGHGLSNLKERYNLLGISDVRIEVDENYFCVYLPFLSK
jgi:sensor histidine kinase YesM